MRPAERSFVAPRILDDVQLEYWALVYLANPHIRARGVLFETFLLAPAEILNALARPLVPPLYAQLLSEQRATREEIEFHEAIRRTARRAMQSAERDSTFVSDGRLVERMKHRTWPRHSARRVVVEV